MNLPFEILVLISCLKTISVAVAFLLPFGIFMYWYKSYRANNKVSKRMKSFNDKPSRKW